MQAFPPPHLGHGGLLGLPLFDKVMRLHQQEPTPTSSADEADLVKKAVLKSPLAKTDRASAAGPSDSEDSGGAAAVDSALAAVDQPLPPALQAALAAVQLQPLPLQPLPQPQHQPQQHDLLPAAPACCVPPAAAAAIEAAAAAATAAARPASQAMPEPWLLGLFNVSLFEHNGCRCHPGAMRNGSLKRNENNQYCLECSHAHGAGMCKLCLPAHAACCSGRVFQIRKYMYQTCVHVDDIQPLYDVSGVQAYCINSRRAVLIHPKNVEKEQKCPAFDHSCLGCHKPLRHDCTYCSLRCKVDVEFGLAPITPKSGAAAALLPRDSTGGCGAVDAAVAAAVAAASQPRCVPANRLTAVKRPAHTAAAAASSLDVSHATRTSSGLDASSIRGKRRKAVVPERSFVA